jgi:hypothetical protein
MSTLAPIRWRADERLTLDCCEVCGLQLFPSERVEVMIGNPAFDREFGGFSAVLASYCPEHAPKETAP